MSNSIKYLVIGAAIGGTVTYFVMKKRRTEMRDAFQEEIDKLTEWKHNKVLAERNEMMKSNLSFEEATYEIVSENDDKDTSIAEDDDNNFIEDCSENNHIKQHNKRGHMDEKYTSKKAMMDQYEDEMDDEPEEYDDDYEGYIPTYPKEGPNEEPYGITPDQFLGDSHLDKMTLVYWEDDGILATEDDVDITNGIKNSVGYDFEKYIGEYCSNTAYIRNDMNGTDYEVICKTGSFNFD